MIAGTLILHVAIFLSMLLLGLVLLLAALVWAMSQMLIAPTRMTDPKAVHLLKRLSPGDLGMWFEEMSFSVRDEQTQKPLKVSAWWIPGGKRKAKDDKEETASSVHSSSVILHPFCNRTVILLHGFADAKVGAIAWAPLWQSLGYNILAIDLRAHGESGGRFTTAGYFERHDVDQVINDLRAAKPRETQQLILFGISLGAAVAAAVAERRGDLDAIILDSPYHHLVSAAVAHGRYMNLPFQFLAPLAVRLGQWRCGARFDDVAPDKTLPQLKIPVLLIFGEDDPLLDSTQFVWIESNSPQTGTQRHVMHVKGAGHVLGIVANPAVYRDSIERFLGGNT